MKIYKVGGAVRDEIMGLTPHDNDFVVVGSTPAEMESLGFKQVGKDFPVYLHPDTSEEYALARVERKSGLKHTDFETRFDPSVTIEDDLYRRDLTMNAIALDLETGEYIDPYGGIKDIENKIIRHVSEAFKEDPLRVLRLGRFYAKYGFGIDYVTMTICKEMVANGELNHISKERIYGEFKKALESKGGYKFYEFLRQVRLNYCKPKPAIFHMFRSLDNGHYDFLSDEQKVMVQFAWLFSGCDITEIKSSMQKISVPADYIQFTEDAYYVSKMETLASNLFDIEVELIPLLKKINWSSRVMKHPDYVTIITKVFGSYRVKRLIEAHMQASRTVQQFIDEYTMTEGDKPSGKLINEHVNHMQEKLVKQELQAIVESRNAFFRK